MLDVRKVKNALESKLAAVSAEASLITAELARTLNEKKASDYWSYMTVTGQDKKIKPGPLKVALEWITSGLRRGIIVKRGSDIFVDGYPYYGKEALELEKLAHSISDDKWIVDLRQYAPNRIAKIGAEVELLFDEISEPGFYDIALDENSESSLRWVIPGVDRIDGAKLGWTLILDSSPDSVFAIVITGTIQGRRVKGEPQELETLKTSLAKGTASFRSMPAAAVIVSRDYTKAWFIPYISADSLRSGKSVIYAVINDELRYKLDVSPHVQNIVIDDQAQVISVPEDFKVFYVTIEKPRQQQKAAAEGLYVVPDPRNPVLHIIKKTANEEVLHDQVVIDDDEVWVISNLMQKAGLSFEDAKAVLKAASEKRIVKLEPVAKLAEEINYSPEEIEAIASKVEQIVPPMGDMIRAILMAAPENGSTYQRAFETIQKTEQLLAQIYLLMQLRILDGDPDAVKTAMFSLVKIRELYAPIMKSLMNTKQVNQFGPNYQMYADETAG